LYILALSKFIFILFIITIMFFPVFLLILLVITHQSNAGRILLPTLNVNCTLKYGHRLLNEGERVTIKGKLHKVEECNLQRAYQTCGTHLWFMLNIVCEAIEVQKGRNRLPSRFRRFAEEKLLTEACCDSSCTVAEMTRYCPT
jgi:hypothetical protein